ncbi:hypothetical protein BU23DRAFT_79082 [Bimuria novae-zelandiae CBS 107.79]|uniref:Uncharacterized protein n=1 Tax=Bimuria novae-zelandiae CBS 107.79 TaxID=1447943 RepID=A0A6A5VCF6_9PLEO|nr:hypothetical protein BU23DRAFT_79082 [Bimuria novae-zelandiae CBS 107.79]
MVLSPFVVLQEMRCASPRPSCTLSRGLSPDIPERCHCSSLYNYVVVILSTYLPGGAVRLFYIECDAWEKDAMVEGERALMMEGGVRGAVGAGLARPGRESFEKLCRGENFVFARRIAVEMGMGAAMVG